MKDIEKHREKEAVLDELELELEMLPWRRRAQRHVEEEVRL